MLKPAKSEDVVISYVLHIRSPYKVITARPHYTIKNGSKSSIPMLKLVKANLKFTGIY